jgi:MFS family permease
MSDAANARVKAFSFWFVLLAAAGTFALTMGTRQTMGLFLSPLNTSTGLGLGSISLAFAFGQLWWGLTQPFAGAMADKIGAGRVLFIGVLLVALGTFITPFMTTTAGLILGTREAIRTALRHPSYLMLGAGFFVCGFHVAFLATHLPGVIASCGLPTQWAGWSLAMIGLFNIVGSVAMGWAVGRWRMKSLLSLVYAARGIAVMVFLLAPKTGPVVLIFAAAMGLTFLSTVPPTAGLVAKFFGPANMATLFGMVLLTHQVGGFLGAWLGGKVFEVTGAYDWVWYIDIVLAAGAALIHLPIGEALPRVATAAARG